MNAPPDTWAIVVAGGSGARFGSDVPKQFLALGGRRVLDWSLELLARHVGPNIVLVVPSSREGDPEPLAASVVVGGASRSASVRAGLAALPESAEFVLVHDAARPFVVSAVVDRLLDALVAGADAVVPALPMVDTVKRVSGGVVVETLDRAELVTVQTPQAFRADVLRRVHVDLPEATDDSGLVEAHGGLVVAIAGDTLLRKVTTVEDLEWLASRLGTF